MKIIVDKLKPNWICTRSCRSNCKIDRPFNLSSKSIPPFIKVGSLYGVVLFIMGLFLLSRASIAQADEITVLRKQAQMRKGPASYYEVVELIPEQTSLAPVESAMNWYKVVYKDKTGFISAKVTQPLAPKEDVFSQMATQVVNMKLSRQGMSAGAKGFASRFSEKIKGNAAIGEEVAAFRLKPDEYTRFAAATYKEHSIGQFRNRIALPPDGSRSTYSAVELGLGMSIAGKIGQMKLMKDPNLNRYINQVGQLVVAASSGFDLPFTFLIIDEPEKVNAYACPGGYVFVTRGLLRYIKDEAELATILAHEIAHVTYQHGLAEISQRKSMIIADNAMVELDEETGSGEDSKWEAIEDDLDQFALNAYETIFEGRLARYELDADRIGLIYAARSGYDPKAMAQILTRIKKAKTKSTNEHYTIHQIEQRLMGIKLALNSIPSEPQYFHFAARWQKNSAALR
jgi:hypothetical protein